MAESIVEYMEPFCKLLNTISDGLSALRSILSLFETGKDKDELKKQILCRLETLNNLLDSIKEDHPSDEVCKALKNLKGAMNSAEQMIKNPSCNQSQVEELNQRLTNAYERLSGALHVYHEKQRAEQQKKSSFCIIL